MCDNKKGVPPQSQNRSYGLANTNITYNILLYIHLYHIVNACHEFLFLFGQPLKRSTCVSSHIPPPPCHQTCGKSCGY